MLTIQEFKESASHIMDGIAIGSIVGTFTGQYLDAINLVKINQFLALIAALIGIAWAVYRYYQSRRNEMRSEERHREEMKKIRMEIELMRNGKFVEQSEISENIG